MYESIGGLRAGTRLSSVDTRDRTEDKFLAPGECEQDLVDLIEGYLPAARVNGETTSAWIESLYFDTSDFQFLREMLTHKKRRSTIRIRRYASSGVGWDPHAFVEARSRKRHDKAIDRIRISVDDIDRFRFGEGLPPAASLRTLNLSLTEGQLDTRVARVNSLLARTGVRPCLAVRYRRRAFEKGEVRITLDSNIEYEMFGRMRPSDALALRLVSEPNPRRLDDGVVMEVKYSGDRPDWIDGHFARMGVGRAKVSKYRLCMAQVIARRATG